MLRTSHLHTKDFIEDSLHEVIALRVKTEPKAPTLEFFFDFGVKADALYKLIMPRLPVSLATEFRQVGATNGFELVCRLTQTLDLPRADSALHVANEIRGLGVVTVCKDFGQTAGLTSS